jgi:CRP-like cAMP-binding protein
MISPETLRRYPYFAEASDARLRQLAMLAEEESYGAGEVIFREGDKADKLYIVVDGEVDIQYTLGSGELRTVDTLVPGELMMWSALVEPYRSTAVGTTRQDTKLIALNANELRNLCQEDHEMAHSVLLSLVKLLATRLEGARVQLATVD